MRSGTIRTGTSGEAVFVRPRRDPTAALVRRDDLQTFPPGVKRRLGNTRLLAHLRHAEPQRLSFRKQFLPKSPPFRT